MNCLGRRVARLCTACACVALVAISPAPTPLPPAHDPAPISVASTPEAPDETPLAAKGEPRLRKLHLVRPDLIPYPIAFEVYC